MKRLSLLILVLIATIAMAAPADPPKLTDAEYRTLITAQRDFLFALGLLNQTKDQCTAATTRDNTNMVRMKNAFEALLQTVKVPEGYIFNPEKLAFEAKKVEAAKK